MKKTLHRIFSLLLVVFICVFSTAVFAEKTENIQIYFSPHVMNDTTGEIVVDVNIRNINVAVPGYLGDICSLIFSFEYDTDNFTLLCDDNGVPIFKTDENTLISMDSNIEAKADGNKISFNFTDSTLQDDLIEKDGTLCRFTLFSKNVRKLWNSFDRYPIRFVPGSVGVVLYHLPSYSVIPFSDVEALDGTIGGYNKFPDLAVPSIDKHITFTADNPDMMVNEEVNSMDVAPFVQNDVMMIPMRFFAEGIGMTVEWNGETSIASSYMQNKTLAVSLKNNTLYTNSVKCNMDISPVEMNGRTFIPVTAIEQLFGNAEITQDGSVTTIYIP